MKNELPIDHEQHPRRVSRRELAQTLLSGLAAGALLPSLSPLHPVCGHLMNGAVLDSADEILSTEGHQPSFLSESQFVSLEKLTEAIVPGSGKARSAAFIDLLLKVDSEESRQAFVASLSALDREAEKTFHKNLTALSDAQWNDVLQAASAKDSAHHPHFQNLKGWAVGAYYSSETGMRELGWTPDRVFPSFPVCTHAEAHS